MEKKSSLFTGTVLMMAMNFVKPALGIFLLPLYLKVMSDAEYGLYMILIAVGSIVNIVGTLRINNAMITFYYDYNHDEKLLKNYLSQLFSFSILLSVVSFIILLLIGERAFGLIFTDESIRFYPYGIIVVATGVLNATNSVYYIFLKNKKYFYKYSYIMLFQILLAVIIQIVLILIFKQGLYGLLLGIMIPSLLTTLFIIFHESGIINFKLNKKYIAPSLKYSLALIPFLFIYWLSTTGDKIILEQYISLNDIGKYGLLMTISGVLFLVGDSVMNGIRPFLFESFQNENLDSKNYIQKLMKYYMAANVAMVGLILLIGHNLSFIAPQESFLEAIPFFIFSTALVFLRNYLLLFNMQLNYSKSSKEISLFSIISLIILLSLYHYFAPKLGLEGVLYAGLIAGCASAVMFYLLAQSKQPIAYNFLDLWGIPLLLFVTLFYLNESLLILDGIKGVIYFFISIVAVLFILRGNITDFYTFIKSKLQVIGKTIN